jgi:hypothetical protein
VNHTDPGHEAPKEENDTFIKGVGMQSVCMVLDLVHGRFFGKVNDFPCLGYNHIGLAIMCWPITV